MNINELKKELLTKESDQCLDPAQPAEPISALSPESAADGQDCTTGSADESQSEDKESADADQSPPADTNEPEDTAATSDKIVSTRASQFDIHNAKPLKRTSFPNTQVSPSENSRLPATIANLAYMLRKYGIPARYNVIAKAIQINIPDLSGCPDNAENSAITYVISLAALNGLPTGPVPMYLEAIADRYQVNPVMDYTLSKTWDGEKRINALADTLVTGPDFPESLKRTLLRKWLTSAIAAVAMPSGFRSRGVLSLQGPQSIGKTSWILRLIDDPLVQSQTIKIDHHLDPGNKDSVLTATSHWIVEIGEVDSSFKKDIARLKGFITADQDKIRRPYGRKDSVFQRRTVFIATVNHANFLVDDTGNSRFWTIPVTSINYNHDINMQQLWAQVYLLYLEGHEWWLTPEEEAELEKHNSKHRSVNSIRDLVYAALDMGIPESERRSMSASELLRHLDINNPSNGQSRDCGAALRELLGEPRVSQGLNRWMVPLAYNEEVHAIY